jgi:hypothetical protein
MTDRKHPWQTPELDRWRRLVPLAVWVLVVLTLVLIPLRIIGYGYLPLDDVLRQAAKAVSGRSWAEILVLNPVCQIDPEFGWNWLLAQIHATTGADAETLVIFSVAGLFILAGLAAVSWLRRPEVWLAVLTLSLVWERIPFQFLLGRSYLITLAALLSVLLLWRLFGAAAPKVWMGVVVAGAVAVSVFFHGAWFLWALPVSAFFLAGQFRWGGIVGAGTAAGVVLGCVFTGHPLAYPVQAVKLALLCVGAPEAQRSMAPEMQPMSGDTAAVFLLIGLALLRRLGALKAMPFWRDPVFWLVCLSWTLGLRVSRFWIDWGWPALMVLVAGDLELFLQARLAADAFRRLALAGGLALISYLALTADIDGHWTANLTDRFLSEADDPGIKGWLPEKEGTFYTADVRLFYRTFYRNPRGDWRYLPDFEPTWMPKEDFDVYQNVLWNHGALPAYDPWISKLRLPDRLAIGGAPGGAPGIPLLEWKYSVSGVWLGRLPGQHGDSAPADVRATPNAGVSTNTVPGSPAGKPD